MRTLPQIKTELSGRLAGNELLPEYVERTSDFTKFADAIGEFMSPYVQRLESLLEIWSDPVNLRTYLESKGMYLTPNDQLNVFSNPPSDRDWETS